MSTQNLLSNIPKYIADEMISYLYTHGLLIKSKDTNTCTHVPIIVYPSPIVKSFFEKISFYQIAFNKLIDKISRDQEYIEKVLTPIAEQDDFVKRNLELSKKAFAFEKKQPIQLGIFRNDYMVDKTKKFIYQIEYNTIAATMGYFVDGLKKFYEYFSTKYPDVFSRYINKDDKRVPLDKQDTIESFCASMIDAVKRFANPNALPENDNEYKNTVIVFVVQPTERNIYDQRAVEFHLWEKYQIKSRRLTLNEIAKECTQDEDKNIYIDGKKVSLFYFRACYTEKDYIDEESWKGREMIELSTAIKCPNINTFLTTFKVFQYELTKVDVIKKYINEDLIVNDMLRFFVKLYYVRDLDKEKQKELFTDVLAHVDNYILKPQKEGGGNNYYGEAIKQLIPSADVEPDDKLLSSIIMEKITPPQYDTVAIIDEVLKQLTCVSEFSVYGVVLSDGKDYFINKTVSYLVRTKEESAKEGGVIVGVASIDLPCLVDMQVNRDDGEELKYKWD